MTREELKTKLEKETLDGMYNIGTDDFVCYTGKGGYIEFRLALFDEINSKNRIDSTEYKFNKKFEDDINPLNNKL